MLAVMGWSEFNHRPRMMTTYFISHPPYHLIDIRSTSILLSLLGDQWFWEHSRVFCREDYYACLTHLFTPSEAIEALTPVHRFYSDRANAKSPAKLGYTLLHTSPA